MSKEPSSFWNRFIDKFGVPLRNLSDVPGRVNLIGEHVDYNGGLVLPMAIPQSVTVGIAGRDGNHDLIWSDTFQEFAEHTHGSPKQGHWSDYAAGALETARDQSWFDGAVSVYVESNVPEGAGLSSSAAIVTAVLEAAANFGKNRQHPIRIAKQARAVENNYIGVPCGIMDQMAVGNCRPGQAMLLDTSTLKFELVKLPEDWGITVIHSGVTRSLNDGRYSERFDECADLKTILGREDLCQLTDKELANHTELPDNLAARLRHVVFDHRRTIKAAAAMAAEDLTSFGKLLQDSHQSYSQDFDASTPEIDALIETAIAAGAAGARLTGGGFGGCVVMAHRSEQGDKLVKSIATAHPSARHITSMKGVS